MDDYAQTLSQKIRTNYAPSDSEVAQIRQLLKEQIAQITQIDEDISGLCDNMLQKRDKIKGYINGLETLLAPTRRIPVEILQKIFCFCLPIGRNSVMSAKEAPLLFSTICRQWREASVSTPNLWAAIHIPVVYRRHPPLPATECLKISLRLNEAVQRWLNRSGTCPLSISLAEIRVGRGDGPDVETGYLHGATLFLILAQFAHRWRKIEYSGTSVLSCFTSLTEGLGSVPLLESISIKASAVESVVRNGSASTMFRAPLLRTLRLVNMSGKILDYPVKWHNLTELRIEGHGYPSRDVNAITLIQSAVALTLLGGCRNLIRCRISISEFDRTVLQQESKELTVLPFLTELWIKKTGLNLFGFYKSLSTPALKSFRFSSKFMPPGGLFPASSLLSRSPGLETLTIDPNTLTHQHIARCLLSVPTITTIVLKPDQANLVLFAVGPDGSMQRSEPVINDKVVAFLTPAPNAAKACPCRLLQHFEFGQSNSITDEVLMRFVESRTRLSGASIGRLRKVTGAFTRPRTIDITEHLSSEIADGLKVDLRYYKENMYSPITGIHWKDGEEKSSHAFHCDCQYC